MIGVKHAALACCCAALLGGIAHADERTDAAALLESLGLSAAGPTWLCPEEIELRHHAGSLDRLERNFFEADKRFRELVGKYQDYRGQLEKLKSALESTRTRSSQTSLPSEQQQFQSTMRDYEERINRLQAVVTRELNALDENSPMSSAAVRLVNARTALAVSTLAVPRYLVEMTDRYSVFGQDSRVAPALGALQARLGPAEDYQGPYKRKIARFSTSLFGDGQPIYRRAGQYRVSLIVAEQTPVTFSYSGATGPLLVPAAVLPSIGLEYPGGGPEIEVVDGERKLPARRITLPSLRIGKAVLKGVPAYVLPADADDLGARFSQESIAPCRVKLEPQRLWLRVLAE